MHKVNSYLLLSNIQTSVSRFVKAGQLFGWDRPLQAPLKTKDNEIDMVWRWHAEGHISTKPAELDGKPQESVGLFYGRFTSMSLTGRVNHRGSAFFSTQESV